MSVIPVSRHKIQNCGSYHNEDIREEGRILHLERNHDEIYVKNKENWKNLRKTKATPLTL